MTDIFACKPITLYAVVKLTNGDIGIHDHISDGRDLPAGTLHLYVERPAAAAKVAELRK